MAAYPGASSLSLPKVQKGQPQGAATAQAAALHAVPMADSQGPIGQPSAPPPTPFDAPTERPNEPVTAGAPIGPGAGPEVMPPGQQQPDPVRQQVAALYRVSPNPDLLRLMELLDSQGR